ncbi:MAG: hypothetical protein M1823_002407 [Watsoniomyces obsoletus]|nr:MAG: hypothetical protein M1823_002407 [Watsoniomyces obsoletus]
MVLGGVTGVLRSKPPMLSALGGGIGFFGIGSTYWGEDVRSGLRSHHRVLTRTELGLRGLMLQNLTPVRPSPRDKALISGAAGGCTGGGLALLSRDPRGVVPATVVFALLGAGGQGIANLVGRGVPPEAAANANRASWWQRALRSRWSPVRVLSDDEYLASLQEKRLRLDVEVALLDDEIRALRPSAEKPTKKTEEVKASDEKPKKSRTLNW